MYLWKDISTAPKDGRIFIAKSWNTIEFICQYAMLPESLGYYGFLKLVGYKNNYSPYTIEEASSPTHWKEFE